LSATARGTVAVPRPRTAPAERTLAGAASVIAVRGDDREALAWLAEFVAPWFAPTTRPADWQLTLSSAPTAYHELCARMPADAVPRACFALDQQAVALPAWSEQGALAIADVERSCALLVRPFAIDLIADPATRRWRFTLQWILHEIAATRLRRVALDLHAAALAGAHGGLLLVGEKGAGKTTLSFHLLRTGELRWIANDRAFVRLADGGCEILGMPTPVKILPPTLQRFPELQRALRSLERPYLDQLHEVIDARPGAATAERAEFALSPAQVAHQLGVTAAGSAPLQALLFPTIRRDLGGFMIERLDERAVANGLWHNLYGRPSNRTAATPFEEVEGGRREPDAQLVARLCATIPAYRVTLGHDAYDDPRLAAQLLEIARR
jgi:hypothetical protein